MAVKRWYPELSGKTTAEVQDAIRRTLDILYGQAARLDNLSAGISKQISAQTRALADSLSGSMLDQTALLSDPQNLRALGIVPPTWSAAFTYTSTPTSITWSWTGLILLRMDGSSTYVPDGSVTITGLTQSTTYFFYPFWDEVAGNLQWVAGGVGTPAYAQTATSNQAAAQQTRANRIQLSNGGMAASTPASGTGGGSGGGGGGGGRLR